MLLESEFRDGVHVLRLKGRFVTGSDAELASAKDQLQQTGIGKAVVDLTDVPYIDSTGLAFIVELHNAMQWRGGQLVLAGANPRVREILALTRIGEIVRTFADRKSALAALRAPETMAGAGGGAW